MAGMEAQCTKCGRTIIVDDEVPMAGVNEYCYQCSKKKGKLIWQILGLEEPSSHKKEVA